MLQRLLGFWVPLIIRSCNKTCPQNFQQRKLLKFATKVGHSIEYCTIPPGTAVYNTCQMPTYKLHVVTEGIPVGVFIWKMSLCPSHLQLLWLVHLGMCILQQLRKKVMTQNWNWSPLKYPSWANHMLCGGSTSAVLLRCVPTVVMWTLNLHRPASDPAQQIIVCNKFCMSPRVCPRDEKGP